MTNNALQSNRDSMVVPSKLRDPCYKGMSTTKTGPSLLPGRDIRHSLGTVAQSGVSSLLYFVFVPLWRLSYLHGRSWMLCIE